MKNFLFFLISTIFLNISYINSAATISTEWTQLKKAIHSSDLKKIKEFVSAGGNVNEHSPNVMSLLEYALMSRADISILKYLIENNAEINVFDSSGYTPLYFALERGVFDQVKLLLEAGVDLNKVINQSKSQAIDLAQQRLMEVRELGENVPANQKQITQYEKIIKLLENEEERRKKLIKQYNDEILKKMGESEFGAKSISPLVKLSAEYLLANNYEDIPLSYRLGNEIKIK